MRKLRARLREDIDDDAGERTPSDRLSALENLIESVVGNRVRPGGRAGRFCFEDERNLTLRAPAGRNA
jgi:hypothetical protein